MSFTISAFHSSVFRVKDADAFEAAMTPLDSAFAVSWHDRDSGLVHLNMAKDCEGWPSTNGMAYDEARMPADLYFDEPFSLANVVQPHLAYPGFTCVIKHVSIDLRGGEAVGCHFWIEVITPDSCRCFYPSDFASLDPDAKRFPVTWP